MEKTIYVKNRELLEAYENWKYQNGYGFPSNYDSLIDTFLSQQREETGWVSVSEIREKAARSIKALRLADTKLFPTMIIRAEAIEEFMEIILPPSPVGDNK